MVHVVTEASDKSNHDAIKPIYVCSMLKPGWSRVPIGLRNLSCKSVTIMSRTVVATVATANLVPLSVAPNLEGKGKEELRRQHEEQIDSKLFKI